LNPDEDVSIIKPLDVEASTATYRLPNNTLPTYYDIHLTTHIHVEKFEFSGHVIINFTFMEEPLDRITLHAKKLIFKTLKVYGEGNNAQNLVSSTSTDIERDFLIIRLNRNLTLNGNYKFEATYDSELRDDNLGFYKSFYYNEDATKKVWVATTQFENVEARSAFPW
jgi:aminopeptidase N